MGFSRDDFGTTAYPGKANQRTASTRRLPCLTILSHPDPARIGERVFLTDLAASGKQPLARTTPDFIAPGRVLGKPLHDPFISRTPLFLVSAADEGLLLQRGTCKTEVVLDGEPLGSETNIAGSRLSRGVVVILADRVVLLLHHSRPHSKPTESNHGLIGESDAIHFLRREIVQVADLKTPILLRGPSGTGKELAARAIHDAGPPGRPFLAVNIAAIAKNLAPSELFGAVKGAYTGADRHQLGFFRAADGGTLFLDEIGEASPEVQVMLLRTLDSGEITPVGAQRSIKVETRLIAATDANLEALMEAGSFKSPLFHRLSGYEIMLPPLAERREDIGRLFLHFAREQLSQQGDSRKLQFTDPYAAPWIPASPMADLLDYHWPGNVRQLRNVVLQLLIGSREADSLEWSPKVASLLGRSSKAAPQKDRPNRNPAEISDEELGSVLRAKRWEIKATAEALGIARGTLYKRIRNAPDLHLIDDLDDSEIDAALRDHDGDFAATAHALAVSEHALRKKVHGRKD